MDLINDIALNDDNFDVRRVAVQKVVNHDLLFKISKDDTNFLVREVARSRLH
jgi:hypothetical protein